MKCVTEDAESSVQKSARRKQDFDQLGLISGNNLIAKEARYHEICRCQYIRRSSDVERSEANDLSKTAYDAAFVSYL